MARDEREGLVERLRARSADVEAHEAADEIERLQARVEEMEGTLEKIAEHATCAGWGRCDMISPCGGCLAKRLAARTLQTPGTTHTDSETDPDEETK